ncbi:hypothetical protein N8254_04040 [Pseudomonadales bacterium]|nr:hypothetical protein [Pseudomonadales bacterium]
MFKLHSIFLITLSSTLFAFNAHSYEPQIDWNLFDTIWSAITPKPQETVLQRTCTQCKTEQDLVLYGAGALEAVYGAKAPGVSRTRVRVNAPTGRSATVQVKAKKTEYCAIVCISIEDPTVWIVEYSTHDNFRNRRDEYFVAVIKAQYATIEKAHRDAAAASSARFKPVGSFSDYYFGGEYPDYSDRPFGLTINSIGELGWGAGFGSWTGSY